MGVASEAASRIMKSALIAACPSPRDFLAIPPAIAAIKANRAGHHVGAAYLTGLPRVNYNDSEADSYLGRLGTFIIKMSPKSTLARSPHLSEDRVQSYSDFSTDFENDLNSFKLQSAMAARTALQSLGARPHPPPGNPPRPPAPPQPAPGGPRSAPLNQPGSSGLKSTQKRGPDPATAEMTPSETSSDDESLEDQNIMYIATYAAANTQYCQSKKLYYISNGDPSWDPAVLINDIRLDFQLTQCIAATKKHVPVAEDPPKVATVQNGVREVEAQSRGERSMRKRYVIEDDFYKLDCDAIPLEIEAETIKQNFLTEKKYESRGHYHSKKDQAQMEDFDLLKDFNPVQDEAILSDLSASRPIAPAPRPPKVKNDPTSRRRSPTLLNALKEGIHHAMEEEEEPVSIRVVIEHDIRMESVGLNVLRKSKHIAHAALIRAYQRLPAHSTPIAYGSETATGGAMKVVKRMQKYGKWYYGLDFKRFDKTVPAWLVDLAYDLLLENIDLSEYDDGSIPNAQRLLNMFNFTRSYMINTPIRMATGKRFRKNNGVASGTYFTQLIGSICNSILISWMIITLTGNDPEDLMVLGDDSLFPLSKKLEADGKPSNGAVGILFPVS
ncbi:unnamed protein product [Bemisia tabaci]|uniref:RdRp catalytic domain-containing protein n=1 Tax=Bemisia tabaci TaxID=7038 RepID=A0A9P0AMT1_BEMTA|nr:unnamed protein product [Bemisia tabaci]